MHILTYEKIARTKVTQWKKRPGSVMNLILIAYIKVFGLSAALVSNVKYISATDCSHKKWRLRLLNLVLKE